MKISMHRCAIMAALLFIPLPAGAQSIIKHVIVIAMENTDADQIYGNTAEALYINKELMPNHARATNFNDPLPHKVHSEPHYIWMEAGTNAFGKQQFWTDDDPLPKKPKKENSTSSKDHLVRQIKDFASDSWMTYQQDMPVVGKCPIESHGFYAAKHNPFVFFQDVSGNPPDKNHDYCIKHHKPYTAFRDDLAANNLANYVFITPNLCNDMHGDDACENQHSGRIKAGDDWLAAELPRMIEWVNNNSGVIFIIWDEGDETDKLPFFAVGPGVKQGHASTDVFNHGSLVKSVEEIFKLPTLPNVKDNKSFTDLFKAGQFP